MVKVARLAVACEGHVASPTGLAASKGAVFFLYWLFVLSFQPTLSVCIH